MKTLLITADLGRLRAYCVTRELGDPSPKFRDVVDEDFPDLHSRFASRDTDQAGRFPSSQAGMSHGDRHEEEREARRVQARTVARAINQLAGTENDSHIYFAAPQVIFSEMIGLLDPSVRERIRKELPLDLVKVPKLELWRRFENE